MYLDDDPQVNTYDLGSDTLQYGKDRIALAAELLKNLDEKIVSDGESWGRLRSAFSVLFSQYGNATYLAASYIGGQSVCRDFKGGKDARDPITPISGDKQRDALKFLSDEILSGHSFQFRPSLLRRLTSEHWYHWGSDMMFFSGGADYPIYQRILAVQRIVLNQCLDPEVLLRIQNQELQTEPGSHPLQVSEVFQSLTDSIWSEMVNDADEQKTELVLSTIRRNLQREHLRRLCTMLLGGRRNPYEDLYGYAVFLGGSGSYPADAKSLARYHLTEISKRVKRRLDMKDLKIDDTTRAHLTESLERINRVLDGVYQSNDL